MVPEFVPFGAHIAASGGADMPLTGEVTPGETLYCPHCGGTLCGDAFAAGNVPIDVEIGGAGVAHLEPLGSGCRFRKGEQRHDESYHAFIDCARAWP